MAQSSSASFFPHPVSVEAFLSKWDKDIQRASRAGARRIGGTLEDGEDFAQEARIRLFPLAGRPQAAAPRYLRKVVANAIKTATERIDSTPFEEITEETEQIPVTPTDPRITEVALWVQTLPAPLRTVYQHLYVDGLTQREAAIVTGVTQPRIAQLHARLLDAGHRDLQHLAA